MELIQLLKIQVYAPMYSGKQEFGGAYAKIKDFNCKGEYLVDKDSVLSF